MNDFCYALLLMSVAASILYLLLKLFIPLAASSRIRRSLRSMR